LQKEAKPGDRVLLKASRKERLEEVIACLQRIDGTHPGQST
jgi:UDP-N-acetylmuramyl pentapeptide synthase